MKSRLSLSSTFIGFLMFVVLWQALSMAINRPIMPSPVQVIPIFFTTLFGELGLHFLASAGRVLAAIAIAVIVAVPIGLGLGQMDKMDRIFSPLIAIVYPIPKIVFLPVIYVLMGITDISKIFLIALIIFFQILVVVRDEAAGIQKELLLSVRSLGAGRRALFRFVYLPASMPAVLTALRVSVGTAIAVLFIAEQSLTTYGLGYYILVETYQVLRYPEMYAGIMAMSLLGLSLYAAVASLELKVSRHMIQDHDHGSFASIPLCRRCQSGVEGEPAHDPGRRAMTDPQALSLFSRWMLAFRPKTLPAAIAPVMVGTALAIAYNNFRLLPALAAMTGALLLQIGVNLANDYFDYVKGVDTAKRSGPIRVTQSGLIPARNVKRAMIITLGLGALVGCYLMSVGGWPLLAIGMASILSALGYSGGPFPLASHGLGDLFVFVFFGLVAVCGTYYVQALSIEPIVVMASIPVGLLITAILVVNNLRDLETDRETGKRTLAVVLGRRGTITEFVLLLAGAYALLPVIWLAGSISSWGLLPVLSMPLAVSIIRSVSRLEGRELNRNLAKTALLSLIYSLLLSTGIVLS